MFVSALLFDDRVGPIFLICIKEKLGDCRRGKEIELARSAEERLKAKKDRGEESRGDDRRGGEKSQIAVSCA